MAKMNEYLSDIKDVMTNLSDDLPVSITEKRSPAYTSIAARASASTYFFPVIVSNSIDPKISNMIVSNLEYAYCGFLKACFELQPAVNVGDDKKYLNIEDYLKEFHQNIGIHDGKELFLSVNLRENSEYVMFPNGILNEVHSSMSPKYDKTNTFTYDDNLGNALAADPAGKLNHKMVYNNKDLEKRNALAATPIQISLSFVFGKKLIEKDVTVAVKATTHPTSSSDIVTQISNTIKNRGLINNLVRYTSGEINSLKDVLFNSSDMKNRIQGNTVASRWFNAIDHRRRLNKLSVGLLAKKPYLPNVSIVLTTDDVADIERLTGVDIMKNSSYASKFVSDNLLIALAIYDPGMETVSIMYEGYSEYTTMPISALKRENDKASDNTAALLKALSRGI